ncbi:MAG: hypothetical protein ABI688_03680 [Bacteroidota bacterium]
MEESILMWNRLESSLRNESQLDTALRFEIRDALWMLTRQWQFGELDGEDAGTAAYAKIIGEQSPISGIGSQTRPIQEFDITKMPLELPIEQEPFNPGIADRMEMGRHWERILLKRLPAATAKTVIDRFKNNLRFQFSTGLQANADRIEYFQHAQQYSDEALLSIVGSLSGGRMIDGFILLQELRTGNLASSFLPQPDDKVNAAGEEFLAWFARIYGQSDLGNTWHAQHLEYQPQIAFTGSTGQERVLRKEEYFGDGIEWHGFSHRNSWSEQSPAGVSIDQRQLIKETVIPAGVRFRGMPSTRLWEMEDAQVDFGSIRASSTELSKMLFAEFGLVYGNDWLIAPVQFSQGAMCRISNIVITDVFGKETILQEIVPDENWSFFQTKVSEAGKRWLFLANGNKFVLESKPVEKVAFLRDEMANMVWGVEEIIPDPFGGGRSGETMAKQTTQLVSSLNLPKPESGEGKLSSEGWKYTAGTLMAENRIPFVPMFVPDQQTAVMGKRKVILHRAAIPRVADLLSPVRIRPRTSLLGYKGKREDQKPEPLLIFEEEIPRTGIELSLVWKRVRWFDGQTFTWLARKKSIGKGEIDANFRFDFIKK